jgi:hypothetical protein
MYSPLAIPVWVFFVVSPLFLYFSEVKPDCSFLSPSRFLEWIGGAPVVTEVSRFLRGTGSSPPRGNPCCCRVVKCDYSYPTGFFHFDFNSRNGIANSYYWAALPERLLRKESLERRGPLVTRCVATPVPDCNRVKDLGRSMRHFLMTLNQRSWLPGILVTLKPTDEVPSVRTEIPLKQTPKARSHLVYSSRDEYRKI